MISHHHHADIVLCAVTANDGGQKKHSSLSFFFLFFLFVCLFPFRFFFSFFGDCNFRSVTFVTLYKSMKEERVGEKNQNTSEQACGRVRKNKREIHRMRDKMRNINI